MGRFVLGALFGALLGAGLLAATAMAHDDLGISLRVGGKRIVRTTREILEPPPAEPRPVTVVLARDGARVFAGPDDAARAMSSVVGGTGRPFIDVPAYRGSDRTWKRLTKCVRGQFDGLAVNVVDSPPARGEFIVAHVGGRAAMFGMNSNVGGLAPHSGEPIRNAPVFVFQPRRAKTQDLCEVAAHEIGHALGLDHSRLCSDVMSYRECGTKRFRDRAAKCGERRARRCEGGDDAQNSWALLVARVGPVANS